MEKKTVLAIFLTLAAALVVMGVVELVAGSIGGTPFVIACYAVIAAVLVAILLKTAKQEKAAGQNVDDGDSGAAGQGIADRETDDKNGVKYMDKGEKKQ